MSDRAVIEFRAHVLDMVSPVAGVQRAAVLLGHGKVDDAKRVLDRAMTELVKHQKAGFQLSDKLVKEAGGWHALQNGIAERLTTPTPDGDTWIQATRLDGAALGWVECSGSGQAPASRIVGLPGGEWRVCRKCGARTEARTGRGDDGTVPRHPRRKAVA